MKFTHSQYKLFIEIIETGLFLTYAICYNKRNVIHHLLMKTVRAIYNTNRCKH
jgi:hypothetical protein